jgi:beta-lactamase class C
MKIASIIIFSAIQILIFGCKGNTSQKVVRDSIKISPNKAKLQPVITDFNNYVTRTFEETHLPGAAIVIVKDSDIIFQKGYGVKTFGTQDSVDVHTVFRIASVSKGFASMLAGILVQEKLIQWDDRVRKYLPHFSLKDPYNSEHLTIRHILSHTSGLPLHTFTNLVEDNIPYATLRDNLSKIPSTGKVGTVFAYQNVIYSLISDVAQAAAHKDYETLLHEKIFTPLGMRDASASYKDLLATKNLAQPHLRSNKDYYRLTKNTPTYYSVLPAAGVNASISDMTQWLLALLGNREDVIDSATLNEIYKPEIVTPKRMKYQFFHWPHLKDAHYGLGWRVLNYADHILIYHGGHINGYRSEVGFCPKEKVGIVILTNASGKLPNNAVEEFFDRYFGIYKPHPENDPKNADVDPHSLDSL